MEETNYSVKVRSIRKNDDGDKFSEYSQAANFFVKKEIEQVKKLPKFIATVGIRNSRTIFVHIVCTIWYRIFQYWTIRTNRKEIGTFQHDYNRYFQLWISKTLEHHQTNINLKTNHIWLIHFFSLNQRKLFRWMDLGKHYPLIGMMIL